MRYWQEILILIFAIVLLIIFIGKFNKIFHDPIDDDNLLEIAMDHGSFENIKQKCGVLDTDLVYTTSLKKISDCINRLSNIGECQPRVCRENYSNECHAWCSQ